MAGRGTDIKLGAGVADLGGLLVLGTERHESRRIDRQLRGRCARQGDPGESKFFISLEDNLMRLFANAGPISKMLENSFEEGDELEHPLLNISIENAQKKVEQQNFSIRKRLLQYDDVLNNQRGIIYEIRNEALTSDTPRDILDEMIDEEVTNRLETLPANPLASESYAELEHLVEWLNMTFPVGIHMDELTALAKQGAKDDENLETVRQFLVDRIKTAYDVKASLEDPESLIEIERFVIIRSIDRHWQDHLTEMEDLRKSVGLRSYGQKDPLNEYKSEAFRYFEELMANVREEICTAVFRSASNLEVFQRTINTLEKNVKQQGPVEGGGTLIDHMQAVAREQAKQEGKEVELPKPQEAPKPEPVKRDEPKVGRNDPCPCGSGKKYKKCCGAS